MTSKYMMMGCAITIPLIFLAYFFIVNDFLIGALISLGIGLITTSIFVELISREGMEAML